MTSTADDGTEGPEFSIPVEVEDLPPEGRTIKRSASRSECAAVASRLGVAGLPRLAVEALARPWDKGGALVTGEVTGAVVQECGVTLEPFESSVSERFERCFLPAHLAAARAAEETRVDVDVEDKDPPELLEDGRFDVGEVAVEEFALALDPFPRKPGAVLDAVYAGGEDTQEPEKASPFAVLERLKKDGESGGSG
jgi:uncharacterized metal-binding protein YceD (DUF177 family)